MIKKIKNLDAIDTVIAQGLQFHNIGKLDEAKKIYNKALEISAKNSRALHLLAGAELQSRNFAEAAKILGKLIRLNPKQPQLHLHRGDALFSAGSILAAIDDYKIAIQLDRNFAEAQNNLGNALAQIGKLDQALLHFDAALKLRQDIAEIYNNRGTVFLRLNRFDHAISDFKDAIEKKANFAEAHNNLGNAYLSSNQAQEAITAYELAISIHPNYAQAYFNRGNAYKALQHWAKALNDYDKAISLKPDYAEAYFNRGIVFDMLDRTEDALSSIDHAIVINPNSAEYFDTRGNILFQSNMLDDALDNYNQAIAIDPVFAEAYWNRSSIELLRGNYERGLSDYEYRKHRANAAQIKLPESRTWTSEKPIKGKTLFIYPELYFGDLIQFSRYVLLAENLGAKVIVAARQNMHALLRTLSPTVELIPSETVPDNYDYHCALMSLPYAFQTRLDSIPSYTRYLNADPNRVETWRKNIGSHGFKVGICWQGSTLPYAKAMRRSFSLTELYEISQIPNVRLISLQKYDGIEQLDQLPNAMRVETLGTDFDSGPDAFVDSAAVMDNLDLIISADTALAHLAGALGRPIWTMLRDVPDWRWMIERYDSPWYPSMTLFRQKQRDDWAGAFAEVKFALEQKMKTCT